MRSIVILCSILLSTYSFAGIDPWKSFPASSHEIIKSFPQDDLEAGKAKIYGHVYSNYAMTEPLGGALVSSLDQEFKTITDSIGYYEFLIDANDTSMFVFKSEFSEHVIWNIEFKEQHVYEINFYIIEDYSNIIMDKPVIYLYSKKDLDVNIKFDAKGEVTFTYPLYDGADGWNVNVSKNGMKCDNKTYPYLFWESVVHKMEYDNNHRDIYGFFVKTDTAVRFLENSLTKLGLNETEQTDFITYWMPRMQKDDYAFVQFIIDDRYQQRVSKMEVEPAPDRMRRVFMLFTSFDKEMENGLYVEQELPGFKRKGFTLVEWGGAQVPNCRVYYYETVEQ